MNATYKRLSFVFVCAGTLLLTLAPLFPSLGTVTPETAPNETSVWHIGTWQALLCGLFLSLVGSFFFNYTDLVRYTWPLRPVLQLLAKYSTTAHSIVEQGRSRPMLRADLVRYGSLYAISVASALLISITTSFSGVFVTPLAKAILSSLGFVCGVALGFIEDLVLPRPALSMLRTKRVQKLTLSQLPVRWDSPVSTVTNPELAYAVIIPCHNYGDFLRSALESVLSQTLPASEIIVVLDGCTDNSADVVAEFPAGVVRSITVNCHDPYLARRAGFYATSAPLVCCLDADDYINREYFAAGAGCFLDPEVGMATGWVQHRGDSDARWEPLPGDIERVNRVSSAGIFRRSAAIGTRAFERMEWAGVFEEDYLFWKALYRAGWKVAVFDGTHFHRRHARNRSITTPTEALWVKGLRETSKTPESAIRVGYVASVLPPAGGVETLLNQLQRHAFRIEWVGVAHAPENTTDLIHDDTYMGIPILKSHVFEDAVRELATRCDVLYVWQPNDIARLSRLQLNIPVWGCVHGQGPYGANAAKHLAAVPGAHCIAVSDAASVVCPNGAAVIYNGADLLALSEGPSRWQQRDIWEIREEEVAIGYVGRWSPEKRIELMLSAFAYLPHNVRPVVCIAGALPPLDERRAAEERAGKSIVWTTTNTPGAAYRALDAVIITSDSEGGPLVALEAWACGCPVITTPVGMIPEITRSFGDMAHLLPLHPSAKEIALAIVQILEEKLVTTERRERAKNVVWNNFTVWRTARLWERGLAGIVTRHQLEQSSAHHVVTA